MGNFILYAENRSSTQADAPSAPAIQGALQAILGLQDNSCGITVGGSWVGSPRITRIAIANPFQAGRITRFAALFQYPDGGASDADIQHCIKTLADFQLPLLGPNWQASVILPYDPNTNGSLDWWSSGQAAATHTQNTFDLNQQLGGTSTIENPTGPQTAANPANLNPFGSGLNPLANPTGPGGIGGDTTSTLTSLLYIGIAGVALYFLWPGLVAARNVMADRLEAPSRQSSARRSAAGQATDRQATARLNPRKRRSSRKHNDLIVGSILGYRIG